ncbi:CocE/NonD family hydrolase [Sphingobacterium sp. DK4209]|uniref:CocE/NonD family hydrolase n=1 Tax=Sphingobacterium zhuxiongii TaxID=2662364 RepID=A0A5Q0Q7T5_9SPHI|nr:MULTISPECIES: CocE/NonD family hydrolase [unclassified Sphingobacterium]MVZ66880.1 CocE/NonD family hydrolase [Sphingobacterium sp. DK4209]QGA25523.1 CocE/NonD family hydrolase [Sphingobacterium sp. dk4302]
MKNGLLSCLIWVFATVALFAQENTAEYVKEHYDKSEKYITMRDGKRLFTAIYTPKDKSKKYPILLNRTPYTVAPYGENEYKTSLGNFPEMMKLGYIFVYQDVRGKWMSEGEFEDIRPTKTKENGHQIDESTDTWDTIDWIVKNIKGNNGKVGMYGISYPGFYATASLIGSHPALKAVSPQAPVTDWFIGDDFHHGGALFLTDAFRFMYVFDATRPKPITNKEGPKGFELPSKDLYKFFLDNPTLSGLKKTYLSHTVKFWDNLAKHSTLDTFWTNRTITQHLNSVKPAVMVVGGLYDAEDTYGAFETYRQIEKKNKKNNNILVMGPWYHGGWVRSEGDSFGDIRFGEKTSLTYQQKFEKPFFEYHLKGIGTFEPDEANIYFTGSNQWQHFSQWPPKDVLKDELFLSANGKLSKTLEQGEEFIEYSSDPNKPVPSQEGVIVNRTREYMIADQRFAANRPDVIVFETDVLAEDLTMAGPVIADLWVSMTGTDADFVVKVIDVYPDTSTATSPIEKDVVMPNYQMLVRGEILRGKFRNSFTNPEPFIPNQATQVKVNLPDVAHTFKKGHKIMVQIQHSWFPLVDRNPNQFMDIFQATKEDFIKNTHRLYFVKDKASKIIFDKL